MKKKLSICILAVFLIGAAGIFADTVPGGIGFQNGLLTGSYAGIVWDSGTEVLGKPVILYAGYGLSYGISIAAEHWLVDDPIVKFGANDSMSLNWHVGYGAYVSVLGYHRVFGAGAYPLIGLSWVWNSPFDGVDRIDIFGQYAVSLGFQLGEELSSPLDFNWIAYTGGFRVYF